MPTVVSTAQTISITEPTAVAVTSVTGTDLNCNAVCDGTLDVTATGGTGTLTYLWDGWTNTSMYKTKHWFVLELIT